MNVCMSCNLSNVKKSRQNLKCGSSILIDDKMYSVVAFVIWVMQDLSKEASPKRRISVRIGSVFSNIFNRCLSKHWEEFIFHLLTWDPRTRNLKLTRHQSYVYTSDFLHNWLRPRRSQVMNLICLELWQS